jgi:hypothetical protein
MVVGEGEDAVADGARVAGPREVNAAVFDEGSAGEAYESQLRVDIRPASGAGIELGKIELGKLTPATVREWRAQLSMRLTPNTVAKCYRLLRTVLETAVADELIIRNPCGVKGAGVERVAERPVATVEQVWASRMPRRPGTDA